jgi:hypothetical protein
MRKFASRRLRGLALAGLAVALAISAGVLSVSDSLAKANVNPRVMTPNSVPFGKTYGQWSAAWWQWAVSFPASTSPLTNTDAKSCAQKQSGPVWYLSADPTGKSTQRVCTIPPGRGILFPIVNAEWSIAEGQANSNQCPVTTNPPGLAGTSDAALQACAVGFMDLVTGLEADLDGSAFENLPAYRFTSPAFVLTADPQNPLGIPGGTTRSVANGFWLLLAPLSAGGHKLHFRGEVASFGLVFEATYTLTITR